MMELNRNNEPKYVTGKHYSNVYLAGGRNCMKVHEYMKFMNNAYAELAEYCEHLEKAFDNACELLEEYSTYDDPTPKDEWKELLLKEDE